MEFSVTALAPTDSLRSVACRCPGHTVAGSGWSLGQPPLHLGSLNRSHTPVFFYFSSSSLSFLLTLFLFYSLFILLFLLSLFFFYIFLLSIFPSLLSPLYSPFSTLPLPFSFSSSFFSSSSSSSPSSFSSFFSIFFFHLFPLCLLIFLFLLLSFVFFVTIVMILL